MDSLIKMFDNVDRRIMYVLLAAVVLLPLVKPLGLPIGSSPETQAYFNAIDSLPKGAIVMISCDYDPGSDAELWPATIASVKHLFKKGARVIGFATKPDGIMFSERALTSVAKEYPDRKYGVDYVVVPYMAGNQNALAAIAKDFRAVFQKDYYGTMATSIPLIQAVTKSTDISLILSWCSSDALIWYPQQFEAPNKVKVAGGTTSVSLSGFMPYFTSGQLSGILAGMRGAAEYEKLIGDPGSASAGMDAQSLSHLLIVFFILMGNVAYIAGQKRTGKAGD